MPTTLDAPTPHRKGQLPQDFQDALSIIFDKGGEKSNDETGAVGNSENSNSSYAMPVDMDMDEPSADGDMAMTTLEMDEQTQYMMYGSLTDKPLVFNEALMPAVVPAPPVAAIEEPTISTQMPETILTPPIQILDAD